MRTSVAAAAVKTPEVFKASSAVAALIAPVCDGKKTRERASCPLPNCLHCTLY